MWNPFKKSAFTVRVLDRFDPFMKGIDRQNDPKAAAKSKALKRARADMADHGFVHANKITDADIDAKAREALASVGGDEDDDDIESTPPAPAPVAAAKSTPTPPVADHSATISALNTRLASMEKELSALKAENSKLKTAVAVPVPAPAAEKPKTPSKVELAEAALADVKARKARGEATGTELAAASFNLTEAKRQAKSEVQQRPLAFTAEDAAKLSHHEKELRLAHLAHAFDQCNGPQGKEALWVIHKDEIRALCAGPLAGWMSSFRSS